MTSFAAEPTEDGRTPEPSGLRLWWATRSTRWARRSGVEEFTEFRAGTAGMATLDLIMWVDLGKKAPVRACSGFSLAGAAEELHFLHRDPGHQ